MRGHVDDLVALVEAGEHFDMFAAPHAGHDIDRLEALRPNARTLDKVRTMLLNETDPVRPTVTVDDRRQAPD